MKVILSEKNIVFALFVMVLVTFSLAKEDSKEMEKGSRAESATSATQKLVHNTNPKTVVQPVVINKQ